jgi:hypothetical protein
METRTATWEPLDNGRGYVVEQGGMLKSGSFSSKESAINWFRKELDIELILSGCAAETCNPEAGSIALSKEGE